uniref:BEN domain-containing protein n=2 Tax=Cacopsylla melanoneura TaxID=428564 RepID=A0A8D8WDD2_9HEMI
MVQFAIAEFVNEETVAVVPTNWLLDLPRIGTDQRCWYPNGMGTDLKAKKRTPVDKNGLVYGCSIIGMFDTYQEARRKLEKSTITSNLDSSDSGESVKKRRKTCPTKKFTPDPSSSSDELNESFRRSVIKLPNPPTSPQLFMNANVKEKLDQLLRQPVNTQATEEDSQSSPRQMFDLNNNNTTQSALAIEDSPAVVQPTPRRFNILQTTPRRRFNNASNINQSKAIEDSPVLLRTTPRRINISINNQSALVTEGSQLVPRTSPRRRDIDDNMDTQQAFEAQLAEDLNVMDSPVIRRTTPIRNNNQSALVIEEGSGVGLEILRAIRRTEEKVNIMWEMMMKKYGHTILSSPQQIATMTTFDQNEEALVNSKNAKSAEMALHAVGGSPGRVYVFNCLKAFLSDGLATQFSLSGKLCAGPGELTSKRRFCDTRLYKIIAKAVREKFPLEKEQDIRTAISDWLSQSKHRIARKRRV